MVEQREKDALLVQSSCVVETVPPLTYLVHLDGARFLASTWLVCGLFMPREPVTIFSPARDRCHVAVVFSVVVSGFVTHWVYGTWAFASFRLLGRFFWRRLGRLVATTLVSMLLGLLVALLPFSREGQDPGTSNFGIEHLIRCFTFVEPWVKAGEFCPNPPALIAASLLPSWLLYPLVWWFIGFAETHAGVKGLVGLSVLLCIISPRQTLSMITAGRVAAVTDEEPLWSYMWPPAHLPGFTLGCVVAALARLHNSSASSSVWRGVVADLSILLVVTCVLAPPSGTIFDEAPRLLRCFCFEALFALFLFGSAATGGTSFVARTLRNEALVSLGKPSLELYLFASPVNELWAWVGHVTHGWEMGADSNQNSQGFFTFFSLLLVAAGLYAEKVQPPFLRWLKRDRVEPVVDAETDDREASPLITVEANAEASLPS